MVPQIKFAQVHHGNRLPKANGPKFFYTNTVSTCSPQFLKACSPKNFKPICKIPKENNGFQFPFSLENLTYFSRRRRP
jgi:hypothetical protein